MNMCSIGWETLGTWAGAIGTIITGLGLIFFTYRQNQISHRQSNQEIINIYTQHYLKLINFYSELNLIKVFENLQEAKSIESKKSFYNNLYHKFDSKLSQLRIIKFETHLFESQGIISVNEELFTRFGDFLSGIRFNKSEKDVYISLTKIWDIEIATQAIDEYKHAIDLLRLPK